ncbi:MAG: hypothetical protein OSB82_12170 [Alphaproteobacteria bacterium]|nr:hypothetical protein [Alphaproteobacteria bacterium]
MRLMHGDRVCGIRFKTVIGMIVVNAMPLVLRHWMGGKIGDRRDARTDQSASNWRPSMKNWCSLLPISVDSRTMSS